VFRTCGRDDQQGAVAGKYILDKFKGKKIANRPRQDHLWPGPRRRDQEAIVRAAMKEVLYEGVTSARRISLPSFSKIKQAGADLVYWGGCTPKALLVRQMRDQGVKAPLMAETASPHEFAAIAVLASRAR